MATDDNRHGLSSKRSTETWISTTTEPDSVSNEDDPRDERITPSTSPFTSPFQSPARRPSPRPSRTSGLLSAQTWPKDDRIAPPLDKLKKEIVEENDTLMAWGSCKQPDQAISARIPQISVRETTSTNDFSLSGGLCHATLQSSPSIVSDAGNQRFRELNAQRRDSQLFGIPPFILEHLNLNVRAEVPAESRFKLQRDLQDACHKIGNPMVKGHTMDFLPKGQLEDLINTTSVAQELAEQRGLPASDPQVQRDAKAVCAIKSVHLPSLPEETRIRSYRQVFAIMVLIERSGSISDFMSEHVSDLDLPLRIQSDNSWHHLYRCNGSPKDTALEKLICTENWSPGQRRRFHEIQWMLLAPFFCRSAYNHVAHYTLNDEHRLPFITENGQRPIEGTRDSDDDDIQEIHGGTSDVFKVHIHPEHHDFMLDHFGLDPRRGFAIKQLQKKDRNTFDKEVEMLKKFTGDGTHLHVISLLATYEQFGKYHLIFHLADGDLFDYWKRICPNPGFDYDNVLWVAKQLVGISEGLLRFHKHYTCPTGSMEESTQSLHKDATKASHQVHFEEDISQVPSIANAGSLDSKKVPRFGRHGDLKPENILWFPSNDDSKGILKIADFGQAELHSAKSKTYRRSKGLDTLTYRPPECDTPPNVIRQSSDLWSLGCIFLEFVTWALGGKELVDAFQRNRLASEPNLRQFKSDIFWERIPDTRLSSVGAQLKPSVSRHIDNLTSRPTCSEYFRDVLTLISRMLIVESSESFPIDSRRANCVEVHKSLQLAYSKCTEQPYYATGIATT